MKDYHGNLHTYCPTAWKRNTHTHTLDWEGAKYRVDINLSLSCTLWCHILNYYFLVYFWGRTLLNEQLSNMKLRMSNFIGGLTIRSAGKFPGGLGVVLACCEFEWVDRPLRIHISSMTLSPSIHSAPQTYSMYMHTYNLPFLFLLLSFHWPPMSKHYESGCSRGCCNEV